MGWHKIVCGPGDPCYRPQISFHLLPTRMMSLRYGRVEPLCYQCQGFWISVYNLKRGKHLVVALIIRCDPKLEQDRTIIHAYSPCLPLWPARRLKKSVVCRSHCMYYCCSPGPSIRNQLVRSRHLESRSSSKGCAASERTSCGEMLRLLQISSRVSSRIADRCDSMAWMVAFATPISLEKSAWDLLPRSIRRFFDKFFDSSTRSTSV